MKKFHHLQLWAMIRNLIQASDSNSQLDAVLGNFTEELHKYCREEKDLAECTRTLRFAHSELTFVMESFTAETKKKNLIMQVNHPSSRAA